MAKTIDMSELQPGTEPGNSALEIELTAIEIAKLCGYNSDRWTRDRRAELEDIFRYCVNGQQLINNLKTLSGKYSQFALEQIQALQKATSTAVPVLKDGRPVMVKGRAKLVAVERQMTVSAYSNLIWEKYGKVSLVEEFDPEQDPEIPGGIDAEFVEEDPELTSTKLVFLGTDKTSRLATIQDDTAAIASQTYGNFSSLESSLVRSFADRGAETGAKMVQAYAANLQKTINQGLVDLHSGGESEAPKTARKTTKKKKVE